MFIINHFFDLQIEWKPKVNYFTQIITVFYKKMLHPIRMSVLGYYYHHCK